MISFNTTQDQSCVYQPSGKTTEIQKNSTNISCQLVKESNSDRDSIDTLFLVSDGWESEKGNVLLLSRPSKNQASGNTSQTQENNTNSSIQLIEKPSFDCDSMDTVILLSDCGESEEEEIVFDDMSNTSRGLACAEKQLITKQCSVILIDDTDSSDVEYSYIFSVSCNNNETQNDQFICKVCLHLCQSEVLLRQHIEARHNVVVDGRMECDTCNARFCFIEQLKEHKHKAHEEVTVVQRQTQGRLFLCYKDKGHPENEIITAIGNKEKLHNDEEEERHVSCDERKDRRDPNNKVIINTKSYENKKVQNDEEEEIYVSCEEHKDRRHSNNKVITNTKSNQNENLQNDEEGERHVSCEEHKDRQHSNNKVITNTKSDENKKLQSDAEERESANDNCFEDGKQNTELELNDTRQKSLVLDRDEITSHSKRSNSNEKVYKPILCKICSEKMLNITMYSKHLSTKHKLGRVRVQQALMEAGLVKKKFACDHCHLSYDRLQYLKRHFVEKHELISNKKHEVIYSSDESSSNCPDNKLKIKSRRKPRITITLDESSSDFSISLDKPANKLKKKSEKKTDITNTLDKSPVSTDKRENKLKIKSKKKTKIIKSSLDCSISSDKPDKKVKISDTINTLDESSSDCPILPNKQLNRLNVLSKTLQKRHYCSHCAKAFKSTLQLRGHLVHTHNIPLGNQKISTSNDESDEVKLFSCTHCSMKFMTLLFLKIHLKNLHNTSFDNEAVGLSTAEDLSNETNEPKDQEPEPSAAPVNKKIQAIESVTFEFSKPEISKPGQSTNAHRNPNKRKLFNEDEYSPSETEEQTENSGCKKNMQGESNKSASCESSPDQSHSFSFLRTKINAIFKKFKTSPNAPANKNTLKTSESKSTDDCLSDDVCNIKDADSVSHKIKNLTPETTNQDK